jgi:MFS family permease
MTDDKAAPVAAPANPAPAKPRRIDWVYATLPINIALGPIGTYVQLYLLQLNGVQVGTVYVAAAVTAFNAVSIPAAIVWGFVTDRLHKRKLVILIGYAGTTIFLLSFFLTDSNYDVIVVYSLVSFVSAASATPLNLLIMETEQKNRWASGFARLSLMASVGSAVGYVFSSVWVQFLPVRILVIPLGLFALLSAMSAVVLLQEPRFVFERQAVVMQRPSFMHRLQTFPLIFLNIPRLTDFRRIFKGIRNELTSYIPLLYLSIIAFYLASGVFNTSLVPAFTAHSLTDSEVYASNVAVLIVQIISFRYAGAYLARRSITNVAVRSLLLRGASYALLGVASLLIPGGLFIVPTLILYPISSGIAYGFYYTASNTMIFNSIRGHNQGSSLGVYSAVVGFSTTAGSLISGLTSTYLGFDFTFVIAGALLFVAAALTARLTHSRSGQEMNA